MPRAPKPPVDPLVPHFLTAESVAQMPETGAQYRVRDAGSNAVVGFAVQVSARGTKTFTLDYRVRGSRRTLRMTFGRFPSVKPHIARGEAAAAKSLALAGRDPAAERIESLDQLRAGRDAARLESKARREAARAQALHTVNRLATDYIRDRRAQLAPGTVALYESTVSRFLAGEFGRLPLPEISQSEARELLRVVASGELPSGSPPLSDTTRNGRKRTATRIGGQGAARTLRRFLVTIWRYAAEDRALVSGPCPIPTAKRVGLIDRDVERFLTAEECARLMRAIDTAATIGLPPAPSRARKRVTGETAKHRPKIGVETPFPADPTAVAALRFALLTGWRRTEVVSLRWDALRRDLGVTILQGTKTDESVRAISPAAWAVLESLPKAKVGVPWCFPSKKNPRRHLSDLVRLWTSVRHAAKLDGTRFHDLRHTAASLAINAGASLEEVQSMLGHNSARATSRYAKLIPSTGLRAAEKLAAVLDAARVAPVADVTPITTRRRGRSA